ncbi:hypothetical protein QZH41_014841 [Actinostola sp. cb2023]|nr:hypothetical protein QZH41_014841 [Actinostola sp. cb2023]
MIELALLHQRIAEQTLLTLQGFLDWVKFNIIFIEDCIVPQMLCLLLNEEELRIPACECLLMIVSRKGKFDQKQEYSRLFSQDALQFMQTAARKACEAEYDEKHYLFLKRLCQVFTTLGSVQLIQMWSKERPESKPETFQQYLETILIFSRHNSLALTHLTNSLWLVILRNDIMVIDKDVKSVIPILLQLAKTKILRVGDPDSSDDSSDFNREDFDNTKEFDSVFTQMRSQVMDIIKIITLQFPVETFFEAADWLLENVEKTKLGIQSVSALQQLKTQWEGMCCYITAVMARLFVVENIKDLLNNKMMMRGKCVTMLDVARNCIQSLLIMTCNDPSILGNVADILHCLSSFLTHAQDFILDVLKKIFSLVTYNTTGKPEAPWTVDVLHTRRRACSALLQMCTEYGNLLVNIIIITSSIISPVTNIIIITSSIISPVTNIIIITSSIISPVTNIIIITSSIISPVTNIIIITSNIISPVTNIIIITSNIISPVTNIIIITSSIISPVTNIIIITSSIISPVTNIIIITSSIISPVTNIIIITSNIISPVTNIIIITSSIISPVTNIIIITSNIISPVTNIIIITSSIISPVTNIIIITSSIISPVTNIIITSNIISPVTNIIIITSSIISPVTNIIIITLATSSPHNIISPVTNIIIITSNIISPVTNIIIITSNIISPVTNIIIITSNIISPVTNIIIITSNIISPVTNIIIITSNIISPVTNIIIITSNIISPVTNIIIITNNIISPVTNIIIITSNTSSPHNIIIISNNIIIITSNIISPVTIIIIIITSNIISPVTNIIIITSNIISPVTNIIIITSNIISPVTIIIIITSNIISPVTNIITSDIISPPMFDELKHYVQSLFEGEVVTIQDRTTLTEALVIASNFIGSSLQNVFIASLLNPHKELLIDNRDSISVEWLIVYLQLNKDPASYTDAHTRSKTKTSHSDRCSIGLMPDGASAHSPCSSHVLPYLPSLLILTQAINNLYGPTARALMFPAYIPSLDMHDSEKTAIFALQNNADGERAMEDNSAVTKTKRYIFHLTDSCTYKMNGRVSNHISLKGQSYSLFILLLKTTWMYSVILACTFKTKKLTQVEEETEKVKVSILILPLFLPCDVEGMEAVLGPLGEILIQSVSVNMQLLTTVFASMTWLDSTACSKASRLSVAFVKKALTMAQSMGSAISTNVIEALYLQILMGFQIHDEAAQSMLLRVGCVLYELLRMQYPSLKQVVLQVTGCQAELEKHLGELFKDEIKIKDLPAIKLPKKPSAIVDDEQSLGLAELFDPKNATELI